MPFNIDYPLMEDPFYVKGIEKGIEKQKAISEAKRLAELKFYIRNMLEMGFKIEQIAYCFDEDASFILEIKKDLDKKK
jgi:hypothetical protein